MHLVAKRKETASASAGVLCSPTRMYIDAGADFPDEPLDTEEELRVWSDMDTSRPASPSPVIGSRARCVRHRYQGVFQERHVFIMVVVIILIFIASTFRMDTRTELEEIERMYNFKESLKRSAKGTRRFKAK
ncbi:hypothetical protein JKF63_04543 [Porcisia hertigi]|uniref:Uncharacterized protein n=1 Tax=Porcisia hertigi TaxID=2761500 RepID=A0A836LC02_9TRYP|nr:hypothetical protein JKF63_04543 [Porcisia hertigi]